MSAKTADVTFAPRSIVRMLPLVCGDVEHVGCHPFACVRRHTPFLTNIVRIVLERRACSLAHSGSITIPCFTDTTRAREQAVIFRHL